MHIVRVGIGQRSTLGRRTHHLASPRAAALICPLNRRKSRRKESAVPLCHRRGLPMLKTWGHPTHLLRRTLRISASTADGLPDHCRTEGQEHAKAAGDGGDGDDPRLPVMGGNGDEGNDDVNVQRLKMMTFVYAALIFVGGLMGYLKKKSKMSLLTSSVASAVMILCAMAFGSPNDRTAVIIALFGSASLTIFFFKRYRASGKPIPGLAGSVISLVMTLLYLPRMVGQPKL